MDRKSVIQDSIALLRGMVRISSCSFDEGKVCAYVASTLSQWGLQYRVEGRNIVVRCSGYDPSKPVLALDAHLDTVPAAASYTRDPMDPGDDPGVVYGLGSNDDGGSVVSMIAVMRLFDAGPESLPFNLVLTLSCEEERSGMDGARFLYGPDGPAELQAARWVIIGEPTSLKAAVSERGLLVLDGTARGVSGHAARDEGVNALYIALDDIQKLRAHRFSRHSGIMGDVRLNVTQIEAGTAHNVVPDSCRFVVDIRPTEQYTNSEILAELQDECRSELVARNLTNCSSATPLSSALLRAAEACSLETFSSPTTSDWMRIGAREGIKLGPGESSRSHRADEYILCEEIASAVEVYTDFISKFAGFIG